MRRRMEALQVSFVGEHMLLLSKGHAEMGASKAGPAGAGMAFVISLSSLDGLHVSTIVMACCNCRAAFVPTRSDCYGG